MHQHMCGVCVPVSVCMEVRYVDGGTVHACVYGICIADHTRQPFGDTELSVFP